MYTQSLETLFFSKKEGRKGRKGEEGEGGMENINCICDRDWPKSKNIRLKPRKGLWKF